MLFTYIYQELVDPIELEFDKNLKEPNFESIYQGKHNQVDGTIYPVDQFGTVYGSSAWPMRAEWPPGYREGI